jgi:cyclase
MIGVIDYGAGNLGSMLNALKRLNIQARLVRGPEELNPSSSPFERVVFPGDGHFASAMSSLNKTGCAQAVRLWIKAGKPFLGVCIGLQLLFEESEEAPGVAGLGVIKGRVRKFPGPKIPQIGWNKTIALRSGGVFEKIPPESYFYYIHSYYVEPEDGAFLSANAEYYLSYCAAIEHESLAAVQFHPEKSGRTGAALLENWAQGRVAYGWTPPPRQKTNSCGCNSLAKRIIPCLDVDEGRVVKGVKFKDLADAGDPAALARRYNDEGADEITFLDIGASYKSRATLLEAVRAAAAETSIPLCVGGGVRSVEDMREAMNAGADKVSVCTQALERPALLCEMAAAYGSQCVVLSIDAKRVNAPGEIPKWNAFSKGGRIDTGKDAVEWAVEAARLGAGEILLNSIDADGTGSGYDLELIRAVTEAVAVPVIASGGAGSVEQITQAAAIAQAALAASILHFGKTSIAEIKAALRAAGLPVRS